MVAQGFDPTAAHVRAGAQGEELLRGPPAIYAPECVGAGRALHTRRTEAAFPIVPVGVRERFLEPLEHFGARNLIYRADDGV